MTGKLKLLKKMTQPPRTIFALLALIVVSLASLHQLSINKVDALSCLPGEAGCSGAVPPIGTVVPPPLPPQPGVVNTYFFAENCISNPTICNGFYRPYFKVYGGDVFAGGWFGATDYSGVCGVREDIYQAPNIARAGAGAPDNAPRINTRLDPYEVINGGIWAKSEYQRTNSGKNITRYFSSTDKAAFALGRITGDDDPSGPNSDDFYSGANVNGKGAALTLDFATRVSQEDVNLRNAGEDGRHTGLFAGAEPPRAHCIPNYFDDKNDSNLSAPALLGANVVNLSDMNSGQYYIESQNITTDPEKVGNIEINGATIDHGKQITLFVWGNVLIKKDIVYEPNYKVSNAPKLAIVALGNVYIHPDVSRVDGLYVAQPYINKSTCFNTTCQSGRIWTCHDGRLGYLGYWEDLIGGGKAYNPNQREERNVGAVHHRQCGCDIRAGNNLGDIADGRGYYGCDRATVKTDGIFETKTREAKLTVNGSLVAAKIILDRGQGDLRSTSMIDPAAGGDLCRAGNTYVNGPLYETNGKVERLCVTDPEPSNSRNIAEAIIYTPEMVIGEPFNLRSATKIETGGGGSFDIQGVTSLPPLF